MRGPGRLHLDDVGVRRGTLDLGVDLHLDPGVVAVVGPNGAGKSTLVRTVAGLTPLDRGRIVLDDTVLCDARTGVAIPPEQRRLGVVFQSSLLFPHLSARDNVAFAPRVAGRTRQAARTVADDWLERIGLSDLAAARPAELSGGQAQRVALARALAGDPHMLLLDEPLAALDVATRHEVRRTLRTHLDEFVGPVVLITHDPVEAATLANRIIVLEDGQVTHDGDVATITGHPRTAWAARLAGVNLYAGHADGTTVALEGGGVLTTADPMVGPVWVTVPPAAVSLYATPPNGTPRNVWPVTVEGHETLGDRARVQLAGPPPVTAEVTPSGAAALGLATATTLWASVKATELVVYPR